MCGRDPYPSHTRKTPAPQHWYAPVEKSRAFFLSGSPCTLYNYIIVGAEANFVQKRAEKGRILVFFLYFIINLVLSPVFTKNQGLW